jgi:GNAT superfamily N-acetyltransferase
VENARRRGIGKALTLQPLIEARKLGYNLGVLGSSEMGYGVYQSLGFKEYCKIHQYIWQPEDL